ncbi:hypothetical protein JOD31_001769 [Methylopila capsulata]|uniref:Uncharacterized protein n=1 Tax=Methylopila capsulata TaxID=61654 RepID=A0A9W6IQD0_9HYPH|nr:hypothetical protein [Methylopila capsulata]MBM7851544.1 hypothetical protein [Methylopila capsulata]GLK54602.1 hypothetical protein GCM10008170_06210 [Methylopila capsulata]
MPDHLVDQTLRLIADAVLRAQMIWEVPISYDAGSAADAVLAAEAVLLALGLTVDQAKRLMIREERRRKAARVRRTPASG